MEVVNRWMMGYGEIHRSETFESKSYKEIRIVPRNRVRFPSEFDTPDSWEDLINLYGSCETDEKKSPLSDRLLRLDELLWSFHRRLSQREPSATLFRIERTSRDRFLIADSTGEPRGLRCFHTFRDRPLPCNCTVVEEKFCLSEENQRRLREGELTLDLLSLDFQRKALEIAEGEIVPNLFLSESSQR